MTQISHRTYTRLGLMGNPSDGFGGRTITVQVQDFYAEATLTPSDRLEIVPHPQNDPFEFDSIEALHRTAQQDGYYGGTRLLYATCKRFYDYCERYGVELPRKQFRIEYDTNIPRQVGLGGSSAIVVATLRALMNYYGVNDEDIPLPVQPNLAREVETAELEIKAGLQDRVAQIYGGLMYMDFDPDIVERLGHGEYRRLPLELLPPLYLAWIPHATTTSGKAHNRVHYRFEEGDLEVIQGMKQFARYAEEAMWALKSRDVEKFADLMDRNFDLRRSIYGDEVIGERNLEMVEIARRHGMPAKFSGSGGAITGVLLDEGEVPEMRSDFEQAGYEFRRVTAARSESHQCAAE